MSIGRFSIGTYVYSNHGGKESGWDGGKWSEVEEEDRLKYCNKHTYPILGEMNVWKKGKVYYAPIWFGYHSGNGEICRIGMSGKIVHQMTQNAVHRIIDFPGYNSYSNTISYGYSYYGRRNPVSIW